METFTLTQGLHLLHLNLQSGGADPINALLLDVAGIACSLLGFIT
jgi:hypothetical protein